MPAPSKASSSSEGSEPACLSERLLSLTEDPNYTLTQVNGQRIYRKAPHAWSGPEPSRDCEVFVGRIPHDCFEDTLVPLFQTVGELFEFRLMINFSGYNRGYGFVMYTAPSGAARAIATFNNYYIRHNWQLGVCPSVNNCWLSITRIPPNVFSANIVWLMYHLTEEVEEVRLRHAHGGISILVEYKSHRGAAMARKALVSAGPLWGGVRPNVDWSQPHMTQLKARYTEIGYYTREHGVVLATAPEEPAEGEWAAGGYLAPSYSLQPWVRARRRRMIEDALAAGGAPAAADALEAPSTSRDQNDLAGGWAALLPPDGRADAAAAAATPPRPASGDWVPEPRAPPPAPAAPPAPGDFDPWSSFNFRITR